MATQAQLTALFKELRGSLPLVRLKAAERLVEIGEAAVPGLIASLSESNLPNVQYVAIEALERIDTPEAVEAIDQWRMRHL